MVANFYTQGEVCTNCIRVFVHESVYDYFLAQLKTRTEKLVIGNPINIETQIGALISKDHCKKVMAAIEEAKQSDAKLLVGGYKVTNNGLDKGNFVAPTAFYDCNEDMALVQNEIFGPVIAVIKFKDESDAVAKAHGLVLGVCLATII